MKQKPTCTLMCLATKKGFAALEAVERIGLCSNVVVCTFPEAGTLRPYHEIIRDFARGHGVPTFEWEEFDANPLAVLAEHRIDSMLCIGWRYLVSQAVVDQLQGQVYIAHDSLLPKLRGFAPLPTALICGEAESGVTFFRAGTRVDDGPIFWQGRIAIGQSDTIQDLIDRLLPLYAQGTITYLQNQFDEGVEQDEAAASYSIWRDEIDYRIDWTADADTIERTIRALGAPYLGASATFRGEQVIVHRVEIVPDINFAIRHPGKIWTLDSLGRPTVVCGRGMLRIVEAACNGQSILPLSVLRARFL